MDRYRYSMSNRINADKSCSQSRAVSYDESRDSSTLFINFTPVFWSVPRACRDGDEKQGCFENHYSQYFMTFSPEA